MELEVRFSRQPEAEVDADILVLFAFKGEPPHGGGAGEWARRLYESGEFDGQLYKTAVLHQPPGLRAPRLGLVGCGERKSFDRGRLVRTASAAVRAFKSKAVRRLAFLLPEDQRHAAGLAAVVEGALLGAHECDRYKTDPDKEAARVQSLVFVAPGTGDELESGLSLGQVLAEAQNFARDLAAEPANELTPTRLAEAARQMAEANGLECEVLDRYRMAELGMGALLGVAQGSAEPPALIVVRYNPPAQVPTGQPAHLGFVGKGVTFDSGGISLKPAEKMHEMKYDMSGGAAVLGALRALARLKPPVPVTGLVAAVENMPGPRAQRPGDIVRTLSGKTVEVLNTDAEGRLILADALAYARRLGCTHLVDLATLTGAIVVALGDVYSGLFSNDELLASKVRAAAVAEGERVWPMPLDEEYGEHLKSAFADLQNIGPRWGGAITAAYFLKEFVGDTPWVHLDIAGTAWLEENKPYLAKGPTGVGVRTLARLALDWQAA